MLDPVLAIDDDPQDLPVEPPAQDSTPAKKDAAADESAKELRRGIKELRGALRESNEATKFWMQQAQRGGEPKKPEAEPEPTVTVDLVEAISNNDHKAVAKALKEMGVAFSGDVRRDLERTVTSSRTAQEQDARLIEDYPDLADEKSEFFQVTAEIYNDLARDPSLKGSARLSAIAAELADKRLGHKQETPAPKRARAVDPDFDVDDEDEDAEQERVTRVRRQAAPSGRRVARAADPGAEELDATQKSIVARLREAGANITEDGYKKRASLGVRMAGLPTRRAR